jgi:hypothetical protein
MAGGELSLRVVLYLSLVLCLAVPQLPAQDPDSASPAESTPADGQPANPLDAQSEQRETPPVQNDSPTPAIRPAGENFIQPGSALQQTPPLPGQQPKRILGLMPNFRAVSAGSTPPPATPKESLIIATRNSFDYSAFVFVGITSLLAEGSGVHPQLGKGVGGFGRYYWRGLADKTDGNYWVIFLLPTIFHQDERYYALGQGGAWKRLAYSATRILITPSYHGHNSFNASEILGRGIAQAISITYYPSQTRTPGAIAQKYGYAIGRDALTNVFREFWPDIATHVLHRRP